MDEEVVEAEETAGGVTSSGTGLSGVPKKLRSLSCGTSEGKLC